MTCLKTLHALDEYLALTVNLCDLMRQELMFSEEDPLLVLRLLCLLSFTQVGYSALCPGLMIKDVNCALVCLLTQMTALRLTAAYTAQPTLLQLATRPEQTLAHRWLARHEQLKQVCRVAFPGSGTMA